MSDPSWERDQLTPDGAYAVRNDSVQDFELLTSYKLVVAIDLGTARSGYGCQERSSLLSTGEKK